MIRSVRALTVLIAALVLAGAAPDAARAQRARAARGQARTAASARASAKAKASPAAKQKAYYASRAGRAAAARKFARVARFQEKVPAMRREVSARLARPRADRDTAVAAIVRLMDVAYLRVGSERNALREEKASFGAASLRKEHVSVRGDRVRLTFRGKSGVAWRKEIVDRDLARAIRTFKKLPGERLFQADLGGGRLVPVTERHVRSFLSDYGALPKDFRTLHANRLFREAIAQQPAPKSPADVERNIQQAIASGARELNHTPAIYQRAYLDPALPAEYRASGQAGRGPPARSAARERRSGGRASSARGGAAK
ncbi:MAG TPA: hypothetical protein VKZ63_01475 [Kofleriaceae bacterium]|nr:hypothetical protein [Kofleriaceae bacterium]